MLSSVPRGLQLIDRGLEQRLAAAARPQHLVRLFTPPACTCFWLSGFLVIPVSQLPDEAAQAPGTADSAYLFSPDHIKNYVRALPRGRTQKTPPLVPSCLSFCASFFLAGRWGKGFQTRLGRYFWTSSCSVPQWGWQGTGFSNLPNTLDGKICLSREILIFGSYPAH